MQLSAHATQHVRGRVSSSSAGKPCTLPLLGVPTVPCRNIVTSSDVAATGMACNRAAKSRGSSVVVGTMAPERPQASGGAPFGSGRTPFSAVTLTVIRHAKEQAARHGSLFVNLEHLVLGLLQTPCQPATMLAAYNIDFEAARVLVDGRVVVPVNSGMQASDVDLSPLARDTLMFGQECAREQGAEVLGSAHLCAVLLQPSASPLRHLLEARQVPVKQFEDKVLASWAEHQEAAGAAPTAQQQTERIREEYKRMMAQGQKPGQKPGPGAIRDAAAYRQSVQDDDDIYN